MVRIGFFPRSGCGQIKLHVRAPTGTRVEETAKICDQIDALIRRIIPANEIDSIVDNIGLPVSGINLSYSNSAPVGPEDADIYSFIKSGHHPTADYIRKLRKALLQNFPGVSFSFLPADMVGQILNFGLPAPINLQVMDLKWITIGNMPSLLLEHIKFDSGHCRCAYPSSFNYPQLNVNVDRSFAKELGITQFDVASNMLISLSGSFSNSLLIFG